MNPRALVVDDHPAFRAAARRMLDAAGIDVVAEAVDAAQAVQLALDHQPDLVLLDVRLPDGDGFEVACRLRSLGVLAVTVLTSSTVVDGYPDLASAAGATGFVPKSELRGEALANLVGQDDDP
jgi:DNA-binding NarL/FixJ family response regulator